MRGRHRQAVAEAPAALERTSPCVDSWERRRSDTLEGTLRTKPSNARSTAAVDPRAGLVDPEGRQAASDARTSGVTGLVFGALFAVALVLIRQAPSLEVPDSVYVDFYNSGHGDVLVTLGLYIVPFAGIAFLWHATATRNLVQALPGSPSEMPRWLQLASGLVFVCMLFAGTAAVGAVALLTVFSTVPLPSPEVARALASTGYGLVFVFGVRAAGMYMITTTTLVRSAGLLPRPLAVIGYLAAAFLLVSTTFHPAILMVFPAWVLMLSIVLLLRSGQLASARVPVLPSPSAPAPPASQE
jgi:hypothetical protein